jgi:hypothetical protein
MPLCFIEQKYKFLEKFGEKKSRKKTFYGILLATFIILNLRYAQINQSIYLNIHIHYHTKILI